MTNVTGLDQWKRNLHLLEMKAHEQAQAAVGAAVGMNLTTSDHLTPIGVRFYKRHGEIHPGHLKTRNQTRIIENGPTRYIGEYYNDAPYAVYVVFGTSRMRGRDFVTPGFYAGRKKLLERGGNLF